MNISPGVVSKDIYVYVGISKQLKEPNIDDVSDQFNCIEYFIRNCLTILGCLMHDLSTQGKLMKKSTQVWEGDVYINVLPPSQCMAG